MKVFGPRPWGPALDADVPFVPPPVGLPCLRCGEPIAEGDAGILMDYLRVDENAGGQPVATEVAQHRECFLRAILGSVGHQQGKCSCFGGTEDDPPGMTRREAAEAAVLYYATHRGALPT